jgi:hypothetical protein
MASVGSSSLFRWSNSNRCRMIGCFWMLLFLMSMMMVDAFGKSGVSRISIRPIKTTTTQQNNNKRMGDEWEDLAERRALERGGSSSGGGVGETAAGAIMGGLLLGPFGALWGASVGANMGAKNSYTRAKQEELQKMGLSNEILEMARDVAQSLDTSERALESCQDSLQTLQKLARTQDQRCTTLYDKAKELLASNDEEAARAKLLERTQIQEKTKDTLLKCVNEKKRVEQMKDNIEKLEERAAEIQALVSRTVSAKTTSSINDLSLSRQDPLLDKFRDAGIL